MKNWFGLSIRPLIAFYIAIGLPAHSFASGEAPQSFTLDGVLVRASDDQPLLDPSARVTIQIMNPTKTCLLYEESQLVDTSVSDGYYNIQIGSAVGNAKRTVNDPGRSMVQVFQNTTAITANNVPGQTCAGGTYTPTAGAVRYFRIIVTPSATGVPDTLTPDTIFDSVPNALVAERAESLQGFTASQFVQTSTNGSATIPVVAGDPSSGLSGGQVWYDSVANQFKYYDGTTVQIIRGNDAYINGGNSFGAATTIGTNDANALNFETGGTTRMTIAADGKVGIGATPATDFFLVDGGSAPANTAGKDITIKAQNATGPAGVAGGSISLTTGNGAGGWGSGSMYFTVGVGAAGGLFHFDKSFTSLYTPSSASNIYPSHHVRLTNSWVSNNNSAITAYHVINGNGLMQNAYFGAISVAGPTNSTPALVWGQRTGANSYAERMRLNESGYLGLGTTTPKTQLEVNGTITGADYAIADSNLAVGINATDTSMTLTDASGYPPSGLIFFNGGGYPEIVSYTSKSGNVLLGVTRGLYGTTAQVHAVGKSARFIRMYLPTSSTQPAGFMVFGSGAVAIGVPEGDYNPGVRSLTVGMNSRADGSYSFANGDGSRAVGSRSLASGTATATAQGSQAMGNNVTAGSYLQHVTGQHNKPVGTENTSAWITTDPLFTVGNGTGPGILSSNALMIFKNGNMLVNGGSTVALPAANVSLTTMGTTTDNTAAALNATDSAGASLLYTRNDGNVGIGTTTPGAKLEVNGGIIAKGNIAATSSGHSIATGFGSSAVGWSSVALGDAAGASGSSAVSLGYATNTNGTRSITIGTNSSTSGDLAVTIGRAVRVGNGTVGNTLGDYSLAFGAGNPAAPRYVNGNGSMGFFLGGDPNSVVSANNVMSIMGGNVGVGTTAPDQKLEVNGGVKLNTATAKPTCDSTTRGTFWFTQGGAGVKDNVEVCAKDAGDLYAWRTLY